MKETQQVALQKLADITHLGGDKSVVSALTENHEEHRRHHQQPRRSGDRTARSRAPHAKLYEALRKRTTPSSKLPIPAMLDAQTQINAI